jgi:ferredoxin-NADP reductase
MKLGEEVTIMGPLGHFVDKKTHDRYLFISIGSGLTPVYSMASKLLETGEYDKMSFLFGERHAAHLLPSTTQLFETSSEKNWSGFYLSQESDLPDGWHAGRIDL